MSYPYQSGGGMPYPPANAPGYPPAGGPGYPPADSGYPPGGPGYPPGGPGYPPGGQGYPPGGQGYPPPDAGYPPPGQGYPPPAGYPPYQSAPQPVTYPPAPMGAYPPPNSYPPPAADTGYPAPAQMGSSLGGVPPGLEYLTSVDQLIIKQKVEMLEAVIGFETNNKYTVKNSMGQKVFQAAEKNDCCTRMCCGSLRSFDMKIKDMVGNEVIHLQRPFRCTSCWCPCFLQKIEVCAPPGNVIGYVYQEWSIIFPKFTVRDAQDNVILRIEGPLCTASICGDVEFEVISDTTGHNVGKISKQWSGLLREAFTDADNFGISFPLDLHVNVKATLLAAAFLIDFMFFEKSGNKENDRVGMFD